MLFVCLFVIQTSFDVAVNTAIQNTPIIFIQFNDDAPYYFNEARLSELRRNVETVTYIATDNGFLTSVIFDQYSSSQTASSYSIYTTLFIIVLLLVSVLITPCPTLRLILRLGYRLAHTSFPTMSINSSSLQLSAWLIWSVS